ncbi:hypothetical protein [Streptomyces incanus]|uniref:Uncharacterized protein n=1 Tax=Streptomyces incanus TaxID=887453 RepID=A0ABW0XU21_9ACTN
MTARQVGAADTALRVARQALGMAEQLGIADAQTDLLISMAGLEGNGRNTGVGRERLVRAMELARGAGNECPGGAARPVQPRHGLLPDLIAVHRASARW